MLIKDDSCIAEKTVMRYQENISELLGSDWYGILLRNPDNETVVDTCYNVSNIDEAGVLEFARKNVSYEFLQNGRSEVFANEGGYYYVYPIRKTNRGFIVFFLFYREDTPFEDKDIRWYKTYAQTGYQRVLLENELVQVRNFNDAVLQNSGNAVAVVDKYFHILTANAAGERFFGSQRLLIEQFRDADKLMECIHNVLLSGESQYLTEVWHQARDEVLGSSLLRLSFSPLRTSKGVVSAVIIIATDFSSFNADTYIDAKKRQLKETENLSLGYVNDIRPMLMNIKGCAELLKADAASDQRLVEYIIEETDKIEKLNREMEVFREVNQQTVCDVSDLNTVLVNCVTIAGRLKAMKQMDYHLQIAHGIPLLPIESNDLYVVLLSILQNLTDSAEPNTDINIDCRFSKHLKVVKIEIQCLLGSEKAQTGFENNAIMLKLVRQHRGSLSVVKKEDNIIEYVISLPTV